MGGFWRGLGLFMLLAMPVASAGAALYECKRPDGTIVFTDDPLKAPGNCQMKTVEGISPSLPAPVAPQPQSQAPLPAEARPAAASAENSGEPALETFQSEAALLVSNYLDARQRYNHASFAKDQLTAMREMAEVKAQKNALLITLEQASLSRFEKQGIMATLAAIPD